MDSTEARLARLEATVEELSTALSRRSLSMKQTFQCPCGATKILHFKRLYESSTAGRGELSLENHVKQWPNRHNETSAPFEAYVCTACRRVEWYAVSLDGVEVDGERVVELVAPAEPPPDAPPYR